MTANTIPGTTRTEYGIQITNLKQFQKYSQTVVDMVEIRRLWTVKNRR